MKKILKKIKRFFIVVANFDRIEDTITEAYQQGIKDTLQTMLDEIEQMDDPQIGAVVLAMENIKKSN